MIMPTAADKPQPQRCDTCGEPCHGGIRQYRDTVGHDRIGCQDEHACLAAYSRLSKAERRTVQEYRVSRWRH